MSSNPERSTSAPALLRHMGLFSLVVYGVGDMIGSGIYGTIGKAAGSMGNAVWLAFLVSMFAALITGMSYACIASRYPRAAGAAYVTHHAFGFAFLSYVIGLTVTASGLTSMATQTNVFAETLQSLFGGPWFLMVLLFLAAMTFINFWGIRESMWTNLVCTSVEVGGLIFIIAVGARFWGGVDYLETTRATFDESGKLLDHGISLSMILGGAVLTFFSFVGFEDMLNVAEEVKDPRRNMPWGIVIALMVVTVLYIGVAVTVVSVVDYHEFLKPGAPAPLTIIANRAAPWLPKHTFSYITMFAVANSMLINYIMGSRLLYGMARHGLMPPIFGRVHPKRRTPHVAIFTLLVLIILLSLAGDVSATASATALLLLFSFAVVNAALVVLKLRPKEPPGSFEVPIIVPACGIVINAILIGARLYDGFSKLTTAPGAGFVENAKSIARQMLQGDANTRAPLIAAAIIACVSALYLVLRPKNVTEESLAAVEEES